MMYETPSIASNVDVPVVMPSAATAVVASVDTENPIGMITQLATARPGASDAPVVSVVPEPEPAAQIADTWEPRTQFGRYVQRRHNEREAELAKMTPEEREMRSIQRQEAFNAFLSPIAQALTTIISKGKVSLGDNAHAGAMARQKMLGERYAELDKRNQERPYQEAISRLDLSTPEGQAEALKVSAKRSKPSDLIGYLENLARLKAATDRQKESVPLTQDELAELSAAPASEKQYAMTDPAGWRKSKMAQTYAGARFDQSFGNQQSQQQFNNADKLRADYTTGSKVYETVRDSYQRIETSARDPSAAGDLSMIFNFMKMLDPGSTVREGEFANAQNAAGVPGKIQSWYNNVLNGTRLNPTQRADFLGQAKSQYATQLQMQADRKKTFDSLAQSIGLSPQLVTGTVSIYTPAQAQQRQTPVVRTQQEFNALPSGATYREEGDPTVYRKP